MTYQRVLPRDLFNEANLLKCLGQLALLVHEQLPAVRGLYLAETDLEDAFDVQQDPNTGNLFVTNLAWCVDDPEFGPQPVYFERPLNSRDPWPLRVLTEEDDALRVFEDDGSVTPEFTAHVGRFQKT